ncbi:uncharacterized protein DUF2842 [Rhodobacter aestuarii]|uniref:DUF2842 domain-containing protein n=1 Tax=Rhodobacter aestuarii TaxID=453582 RepID=A0A1N7P8I4_9RHOB|nr:MULTISPECIES: DUF2842 domain-containing protein [Rhodobacter]PTV97660.1 uncharacterized protein DUF2842 [Rhodobacter aestuarii]SIT06904.1 Protein of unknown function [Rhodobacter aestuarii]SOC04749.1 uncharacterized protein DUF2842 [Rhodobacter sp. JA431]
MALSYRTRRRLSLLVLVLGLPAYIVVAVSAVAWAEARWGMLPWWGSVLTYLVLGVLWIVPLKPIFIGVGKPDPDAETQD